MFAEGKENMSSAASEAADALFVLMHGLASLHVGLRVCLTSGGIGAHVWASRFGNSGASLRVPGSIGLGCCTHKLHLLYVLYM
jgi:hypothetical protein